MVCQSADNGDLWVEAGSSDHGQQPQALPVGGRPLAHGGHAQDQSAGMVNQPPRHMEEQEAQTLGACSQQFPRTWTSSITSSAMPPRGKDG